MYKMSELERKMSMVDLSLGLAHARDSLNYVAKEIAAELLSNKYTVFNMVESLLKITKQFAGSNDDFSVAKHIIAAEVARIVINDFNGFISSANKNTDNYAVKGKQWYA